MTDGFALKSWVIDIINKVSKKNGSSIYSTDEKVIGKWIDGKPIYRKVAKVPLGNWGTAWNNTGVTVENGEKIINITSYYTGNGSNLGSEVGGGIFGMLNNNIVYLWTCTATPIDMISVEYTKTTDKATN